MRTAALIALSALLPAAAPAAAHPRPTIVVSRAVVRATYGHAPDTAAYMTLTNRSGAPDRLLGAACDCAARVELHETRTVNGVASMSATPTVIIPAHGSVAFTPDGRHLMVMGLKRPLADGQVQPFTLTFQRAGALKADFRVRARIDAGGMAGMDMGR